MEDPSVLRTLSVSQSSFIRTGPPSQDQDTNSSSGPRETDSNNVLREADVMENNEVFLPDRQPQLTRYNLFLLWKT